MFGFKKRRRERLKKKPPPKEWLAIIEKNVRYYGSLAPEEKAELHGHIQVFLDEKHFEGCGGLEMTDEIRVTIAAQACILLLNRETDYYPDLVSILVYPSRYVANEVDHYDDGIVIEEDEIRLGESWEHGIVVLSWDDVLHGGSNARDGYNVVLHEFAHQLDGESGWTEGVPDLETRAKYASWAKVMSAEYEQLIEDLNRRRSNLFGAYAASDPAEFFAVLTECFFEKPERLKSRHPELYETLKDFFKQDPASRIRPER